ncbi:hypothetical protein SKAU_G00192280 [Synaphobranchus kaupii]|uniref:Calponin-homology (CH) domain-containing protein n=1 Tax=Synaphobranchus kaupii TaxID=118154 RepID=A0A9Q1FDW6_SYNKA|nr:hypothetical protein SKAU_G00192280 [Synaphobranchus kaupii]
MPLAGAVDHVSVKFAPVEPVVYWLGSSSCPNRAQLTVMEFSIGNISCGSAGIMASGSGKEDPPMEEGTIPLDIDNIQMLLQVEQEQIQKRTFTNWINAQLSKRSPPSVVSDLFSDLWDGVLLLDLLEVLCGQSMKREKGRGVFQGRSNVETALNFLKKKSIKLVNINIPDIIDGRPSIILGLIWSIILHCHIEELASSLSFSSRQSSLESLGGLDSPGDSPVQQRPPPLHARLRISAKKALLLWVREQCNRAGCSLNIKDFKSSWRSGEVFLAVLCSLRPDLVDLSQVSGRTNQQNLEEAFRIAERELRIPRLLEPEDIDIRDPDEKSIMTYVAQFLQYSKDQPASEKDDAQMHQPTPPTRLSPVHLPTHFTPAVAASPVHQASANQKVREVTCWLRKVYRELQEGWSSAEAGNYVERYQAFQMCVVPFEERRRHVTPMLSVARGPTQPNEDQRSLREAWDVLADKLQQCDRALDMGLPAPLDAVGRWLLQVESVLTEEKGGAQDHSRAAQDVRDKTELLKTTMKDMDLHQQTLRDFSNKDEYGSTLVPVEKLDQLNRRFTSARVTAKYHGMILDYLEFRYTVLDLLAQADSKLRSWSAPYNSQESVHVRLKDWHETVDKHGLVSHLETSLEKMKLVANNYSSKAALAEDSQRVSRQVREAEVESALKIEAVAAARTAMERALSAWDTYNEGLSSLQAWLEQEAPPTLQHGTEVMAECLAEWSARHVHLNEVGNYLTEVTEDGTSCTLAAQLQGLNKQWADFVNRTRFAAASLPGAPQKPPAVQQLTQEAALLMKEPVEVSCGPLRTYRKKLQLMIKKVKEVDALAASPDWSPESQQKLHKVMRELHGVEQASAELQRCASALECGLAELEHWETEARELLKEGKRRGQQGHDPKTKVLISCGLQLEGQLVAEEQDYEVGVGTVWSHWPQLCLSSSQMQDRVRHTLSQAQVRSALLKLYSLVALGFCVLLCHIKPEAVGMLSSLGVRQHPDPADFQPPPKILILSDTQGAPLSPSQTSPQHQLRTTPEPQCQTTPQPQNLSSPRPKPRLKVCPPRQERREPQLRTEAEARDQFEKAKHQLQDHIQAAITAFCNKEISEEQAVQKEASLQLLNSEILEEFLRSLANLKRFCSTAQLRDMETLSHSMTKQWEACLRADAGQRPEALKTLSDTLSPGEKHIMARAQLKECVQMTTVRTGDTMHTGASHKKEPSTHQARHRGSKKTPLAPEFSQAIVRADRVEVKQMAERTVIEAPAPEEGSATQEEMDRYRAASSAFRDQLERNQQSFQSEFLSDSDTPSALRANLDQLQVLKEETEGLWFEFELQYSQCSQLKCMEHSLAEDREELLQQWRAQQISLQRRVKSLGAAVWLISPVGDQMTHVSQQLDHLFKNPKDICGLTLNNASMLQDNIKDLEEKIQQEIDRLSGLECEDSPVLSELDQEARLTFGRAALGCRRALDQFRQRVWRGGEAVQSLDRFLASLRAVERDISGAQASMPGDARAARDGRSRLVPIRQSVRASGEEAVRLDQLLEEAQVSLVRNGTNTSCQDLVLVLVQRLEEADTYFAHRLQEGAQQEPPSLGKRRKALIGALEEVQDSVESQALKEPTLPALQRSMRALADTEAHLTAQCAELQSLREATAQPDPKSSRGDPAEELEALWEETHRTVTERREQYRALTELLKKFQSCRGNLRSTLQRAEQTIGVQASYMGKDNLQRLIAKVQGVKEDLAGLAEGVDEIRGVGRQLQSHLRVFPDCANVLFDSEADNLVDHWLDVTEKTDSHLDSLLLGLALWEKLLQLGRDVESWTGEKLASFAEGHPFHSEQEVKALQDKVREQEEKIEHFHRRSAEIQEMLQSKESPLDLQVMETQMRNRMEQVKELFSESRAIFRGVAAARECVAQRMEACRSALRDIQSSLSMLDTSHTPPPLHQIQALSAQLKSQVEERDALIEEVRLLSGMASPQAIQSLAAQGLWLKEDVRSTQDLINQKGAEAEKGLLKMATAGQSDTKAGQQEAQVLPAAEEVVCTLVKKGASPREEGFPVEGRASAASQHVRGPKAGDQHSMAGKAAVSEKPGCVRKRSRRPDSGAQPGATLHSDTQKDGHEVTEKAGSEPQYIALEVCKVTGEPMAAVKVQPFVIRVPGADTGRAGGADAGRTETPNTESLPESNTEARSSGTCYADITGTREHLSKEQPLVSTETPKRVVSVPLDSDSAVHQPALHTVAQPSGSPEVRDTDPQHTASSLIEQPKGAISVTLGIKESGETGHVGPGPCKRTDSASAETAVGKTPLAGTETERAQAELQGTTETLQPQSKSVALVLDTDTLHVHTPETCPFPRADVLRILSSGGADFPAAAERTDAQRAAPQTSPCTDLSVELTGTPETQEQHRDSQSTDAALVEVVEETASTNPARLQEEQAQASQNQPSQTLRTGTTDPDEKKRAEDSGSLGHPESIISAKRPGERGAMGLFPGGHRKPTVQVGASPHGQDQSLDQLSGSSGPKTFAQVQYLTEPISHITEMERATARLDQIQTELPDCSEKTVSLEELRSMLGRIEQCQHQLENESHTLAALQRSVCRRLDDPTHQGQATPIKLCQELQAMQDRCKKLREMCMLDQQTVRSEVQEWEQVQEEIRAVRGRLVAMAVPLSKQGPHPSTRKLQEIRKDLNSQNAVLLSIINGLKKKYSDKQALVPAELESPLQEVTMLLKELEGKAEELVEKSGPLYRLSCKVTEVMEGLRAVQDLLQQKSPSVAEAQITQKRAWDALDRWHSYVAVLEGEVQDVREEQPEQAQLLMDKLMEPLQLHQDVAKQAEQRTAFLSKVPTLLQEYEEMIGSSNRWLREAQSWLDKPIIYTTSKCLSSHAQGLQAVLDDSEQTRRGLQGFSPTLQEISSVFNTASLEEKLFQADQHVAGVQRRITGPLSRLQYAALEVEAMEGEVKLLEKNVTKMKSILSSIDTLSISPEEHLKNRQVILDNIQSMKRTIAEIQKCRSGLELPEGASDTLSVFHRAHQLLQPTHDLERLTLEQSAALQMAIEQSESTPQMGSVIPSLVLSVPGYLQVSSAPTVHKGGVLFQALAVQSLPSQFRLLQKDLYGVLVLTVVPGVDPVDIWLGEGYAGATAAVTTGAGVTAEARFVALELLRESGLAHQGEDVQPEGVKVQGRDAHPSHGPACTRSLHAASKDRKMITNTNTHAGILDTSSATDSKRTKTQDTHPTLTTSGDTCSNYAPTEARHSLKLNQKIVAVPQKPEFAQKETEDSRRLFRHRRRLCPHPWKLLQHASRLGQ